MFLVSGLNMSQDEKIVSGDGDEDFSTLAVKFMDEEHYICL